MKVVCVDKGEQGFLTVGKEYEVTKTHYSSKYYSKGKNIKNYKEYWLINDIGSSFCYAEHHFITLSEYRKRKLIKINSIWI